MDKMIIEFPRKLVMVVLLVFLRRTQTYRPNFQMGKAIEATNNPVVEGSGDYEDIFYDGYGDYITGMEPRLWYIVSARSPAMCYVRATINEGNLDYGWPSDYGWRQTAMTWYPNQTCHILNSSYSSPNLTFVEHPQAVSWYSGNTGDTTAVFGIKPEDKVYATGFQQMQIEGFGEIIPGDFNGVYERLPDHQVDKDAPRKHLFDFNLSELLESSTITFAKLKEYLKREDKIFLNQSSLLLMKKDGKQRKYHHGPCIFWKIYWTLGYCEENERDNSFWGKRLATFSEDSVKPVNQSWILISTWEEIEGVTLDFLDLCQVSEVRAEHSTHQNESRGACLEYHTDEWLAPIHITMNPDYRSSFQVIVVGGTKLKLNEFQTFKRCINQSSNHEDSCYSWLAWIPVRLGMRHITLASEEPACSFKEVSVPVDDDDGYGDWSNWSNCSSVCGEGEEVRMRECRIGMEEVCQVKSKFTESRKCNLRNCKGEFSAWGEWGSCNVKCVNNSLTPGSITRERNCTGEKCDEDELKESRSCWGDPEPNFCSPNCTNIDMDLEKSRTSALQYDLTITLHRPNPGVWDNIKRQTVLVRDIGSDNTVSEFHWKLTKEVFSSDIVNGYISKRIDFTCSNCTDSDDTCTCIFTSLRLEHTYNISLIIDELSPVHQQTEGKTIFVKTYCPYRTMEIDKWTCHNRNESIPAKQVCDGNHDCQDKSDESDTMCKGESTLLSVLVPLGCLVAVEVFVLFVLRVSGSISLKRGEAARSARKGGVVGKGFLVNNFVTQIPWNEVNKEDLKEISDAILCAPFQRKQAMLESMTKHYGQERTMKILAESLADSKERKLAYSIILPNCKDTIVNAFKKNHPEFMMNFNLVCEVVKALCLVPFAVYDTFKDISLVMVLFYFYNEVLQGNLERVGNLRLDLVNLYLSLTLLLSHLILTWVRVVKSPGKFGTFPKRWMRLSVSQCLMILPGWHSLMTAALQLELNFRANSLWRKMKGKAKVKFSMKVRRKNGNEDEEGLEEVLAGKVGKRKGLYQSMEQVVEEYFWVKKLLRKMKEELCRVKAAEAVLEQFLQTMVCITILIRQDLRVVFLSTITKSIPNLLEVFLVFSLWKMLTKLLAYKSAGKISLISPGGVLLLFSILIIFIQKAIIYIVYSFQFPFIIVFNILGMALATFAFNKKCNKNFSEKAFVDQVIFCLVSSIVPVTYPVSNLEDSCAIDESNQSPGDNNEMNESGNDNYGMNHSGTGNNEMNQNDNVEMDKSANDQGQNNMKTLIFRRRKSFHQGLFSFCLHFAETIILLCLICVQHQVSEEYRTSVTQYLPGGFSRFYLLTIVLVSFILSPIATFLFYRCGHPWRQVNLPYPMMDPLILLPVAMETTEEISFNQF